MGTRKKWTNEEKLAAVLEGLAGRSAREICVEYGISDSMYYKWRDQAINGMKQGLSDKRQKSGQSGQADRDRLLKIIGEQQTIIDLQKKISQRV